MLRKKQGQQYLYQAQQNSKQMTQKEILKNTSNTQGKAIKQINIINISALNIGAPNYIRIILEDFKKDTDSNTIMVGDFNTPRSKMDISFKQNIKKDIVSLNNPLDEMDLTNIYREPFIPEKQNTHSFQMHMEHFQRQTP